MDHELNPIDLHWEAAGKLKCYILASFFIRDSVISGALLILQTVYIITYPF